MWNHVSDKESYLDFMISAACQVSHVTHFLPTPNHSILFLAENVLGIYRSN